MKSLNEITQWHYRSLQKWIREIEENDLKNDLILIMPHLPNSVSHIILENLSSRVRKIVIDSMSSYKNRKISLKLIQKIQSKLLDIANELIESGILNPPGEDDNYQSSSHTELPFEFHTQQTDQLINTLTLLGKYAQERGILSLENALSKIKDPFLKEALQLIIDGTSPELVEEILRNRMQAISSYRELLYNLMIEGVLSIQEGNSNWTLEIRLKSHLPPEFQESHFPF